MNAVLRRLSRLAGAIAVAAGCGSALADSTWSLTACSTAAQCSTTDAGGGVAMTATAYAADAGSSNFYGASVVQWGGGIGIYSSDPNSGDESSSSIQPDHAMDNDAAPGADYSELVHLSFTKSVDLATVTAGWTWSDSDVMVFRWTGTCDPSAAQSTCAVTSFTPNSMNTAGSGWTLVANSQFTAGASDTGGSVGVNQAGDSYSSHWIVTTAFGGRSDAIDGFKLKSFTGAICALTSTQGGCSTGGSGPGASPTPEPGSLALAVLAALGVAGARRRKAMQA